MGGKSVYPSPSFSKLSPTANSTTSLQKFLVVVRSTLPYLLFLFVYAINKVIHIQPLAEDLGCVHIHTINDIEGYVFGGHPNKLISNAHNSFLDILSAIPYLIHYGLPVVFPLFLLITGRIDDICRFYWLLGWVMWMHYLVWLVFPHAPPWVLDHLENSNSTSISLAMEHKEGCAFARVDKLTGLTFFNNMFSGNPIPYGSFPSGHVAWPLVLHITGGPGGNMFLVYIFWMGWATLYTCHHYLLDIVGAFVLVLGTKRIVAFVQERGMCSADYRCRPTNMGCPIPV